MTSEQLRLKLAWLCLNRGNRINGRAQDVANRWKPNTVRHPELFGFFTEDQAWEFISDKLKENHPFHIEPFRALNNIDCAVMKIRGCDEDGLIYIKIAYLERSHQVLGISFHISDPQ